MKKCAVIFSVVLLFVISISIYWFYFSKPSPFLTDEQLMNEINQLSPRAVANIIQDTIFIDKWHVVVPFISENQNYGFTLWIWKNNKWRVAYIDTKGSPRLWKVNAKDPNTYHIVWNIPPQEDLRNLKYYLINDRSYSSYGNNHQYKPKVQMEIIDQADKSFGVISLPKEWATFMEMSINFNSMESSMFDFPNFFHSHGVVFGWNAYNYNQQIIYPEGTVNGDTIHKEQIDLEYIMFMDESMLEFPSK